MTFKFFVFPTLLLLACWYIVFYLPQPSIIKNFQHLKRLLPFDKENPVLYDNDDHRDTYTDEYLFSLASAGTIKLEGVITTYSANKPEYDLFVKGRQEIIDKARISGLKNLPDALAGPFTALQRPATNRIEDTKPLRSAASKLIVQKALQSSPSKPLVIITGGQLTAIADAYLQDSSITGKVIINGLFGARDKTYNGGLDAWAWAIVLCKFKCVSFSDSDDDTLYNQTFKKALPQTPKQQFANEIRNGKLPNIIFYKWMYEKHHPVHPASYMQQDGDAPPALSLTRPDYVEALERWRCSGINKNGLPVLERDEKGSLYLVTKSNATVATEEFWRALEDSTVWTH